MTEKRKKLVAEVYNKQHDFLRHTKRDSHATNNDVNTATQTPQCNIHAALHLFHITSIIERTPNISIGKLKH